MDLHEAIRARRSVRQFTPRPIGREQIEQLLDSAVQAPNHRLTQPWRFYVLGPEARRAYGTVLGSRKAKKVEDPVAAQAGEHGKGFAVVAEEIRELSNRTSVSTHEISSVINDIRQETDKVTRAIALTEKSVSEGEGLSSASGEALKKIVTGIHDVDRRMEQMSRATHEQSQGTRTIRVEMEKVSQMVDQTVSATREQSKSASSIMTAVENMKELTFQVKTSTREQSNGSKVIATTMEDINKMLQNINEACENQNHESSEISQAIEDIKQVADSNLGASGVLQKAVAGLNSQVQNLKKEMGFFRLSI